MTIEIAGDAGHELGEQAARAQHFQAARTVSGEEQFERLVEQARRRHAAQQFTQAGDRGTRFSPSSVKPSLASKRAARSMRTGSSR
jgi:hypothetical protein